MFRFGLLWQIQGSVTPKEDLSLGCSVWFWRVGFREFFFFFFPEVGRGYHGRV